MISFEICSTPKESKYVTVLLFTYNAAHEFQYYDIHQDLLHKHHFLLYWVDYLY